MVKIKFPDTQQQLTALGFLAGRFSFKSFDDGTMLVPEVALGYLAAEDIRFTSEGRAVYGQLIPTLRDSAPAEAQ